MDNNQLNAMEHVNGPALVIAGPGCGKTTVISRRIVNLVNKHNINQKNIVALSFTKFSSIELKNRTLQLNSNFIDIFYGTIHSFFLSLLIKYFHYPNNVVIGTIEKQKLLKIIICKTLNTKFIANEAVEIISNHISRIKNYKYDNKNQLLLEYNQDILNKIYINYTNYLNENELIDYDDILIKTFELLKKNELILSKIKLQYTHFIIDEFQDINEIQFNVIKLLLDNNINLFVVGDEDQSIYNFRGASPRYMITFNNVFETSKIYPIIKSYRCPQKVLLIANNLISYNNDRTQKYIISSKDYEGEVKICNFKDRIEQAYTIGKIIKNKSLEEHMVIYRTNSEALVFIKIFNDLNINFMIKDKIINFFSHFIYKDIQAYLKFSISDDINSLNRIKNKPKRNLLNIKSLETSLINNDSKRYFSNIIRNIRILSLVNKIKSIKNKAFVEAVDSILYDIGYSEYLNEYCKTHKISKNLFDEIINNIVTLISPLIKIQEGLKILELLEKKYSNCSYNESNSNSKVFLVTAHGCKGLESDNVYVTSLNESIFPHHKSFENNNLEEERRLAYVSITRAKRFLHLSSVSFNNRKKLEPSRFLKEILISNQIK